MLYPVAIEKGSDETAFGVIFPDIPGCFSAGDTYQEALNNAREALEFHLEGLAEDGELPPVAGTVDDYLSSPEYDGFLWAMVDIDVDPYMGGSIKKNVTLPKLLLAQIDGTVKANAEYKDRSHFLQIAAMHELIGKKQPAHE